MSQRDIFETAEIAFRPELPKKKGRYKSQYLQIEERLWASGYKNVAGVDEVGRGPLAGPVVACACILPQGKSFPKIKDSKQLSEDERNAIYSELTTNKNVYWAVSVVDHEVIDKINILRASLLAMKQALESLSLQPDFVLIDGRDSPPLQIPHQAVIKGDSLSQTIAAASVLAKVTRDRMMVEFHEKWPEFGFADHKGYGTEAHLKAIAQHGLSPIHRTSFAPIARHLKQTELTLF